MNTDNELPSADIKLPIQGEAFQRADASLIAQLHAVSSATASALLSRMGIRQTFIEGPRPIFTGKKIVGSTITLQFMPQREDVASGKNQEYSEKFSALWAVLETVQAGDVLTIQAYGDAYTGCLGEMLVTYFQAQGGVGIVVDGFIRDAPKILQIGLPMWVRGYTPNYASQSGLFPWAYNVPIACSRVLVIPGDIILADDDGAVVIPRKVAPQLLKYTLETEDWESFSRMRIQQGGALGKYYPLNAEARQEYEQWRNKPSLE
ncbi:MAG: ribonuclease activity regulator RraA [bacterium]|nr:ribonuclease activity regulator RraA [bacterium]